jgi:glycosyltransferase involved in cell wall biosynthesis
VAENTGSVKTDVSVVIPLLNEEESLPELADGIRKALEKEYRFEIIFVDDGSTDNSWQVIQDLREQAGYIRGIRLRRNYGKSVALQAGFERAEGDYVVTMDADLQDDPNEVPEMLQMIKDGHDLVSGWKKVRHDPIQKTIPSRFFNFVTRKVSGIHLHDFNCGLKAYRKDVVKSVYVYGELHRYIPMLAKREGFSRITEKVVTHHARKYGKTKFGLNRFINGFVALGTLLFVQKYLQKPMHFFGTWGVLFMLAGGGINIYLAVIKVFYGASLSNRPLLFLGILLLVLGVQLFSTGLIGELINRNHVERQKPGIRDLI